MTMKTTHTIARFTSVALALTLGMLMPACGGGGGSDDGGNGGTNPLTARFTPANSNPGPNTLNMTASTSGANFTVRVNVTGINDFFGAAFDLTYNPSDVNFVSAATANSVLITQGGGVQTQFNVDESTPGVVSVSATRVGQVAGIDIAGTSELISLNFKATDTTGNNPFTFGTAAERLVETCPAPPAACSDVPDGSLTWSGGTMTASR
jgi:hypothetical protein